jgi:hypothetical protein
MSADKKSLVVLWTSGDREVALKMVFMYTLNAKLKGWWEEVILIVWGPSARLLSQDEELREKIGQMRKGGIVLEACKACADLYGVTADLEALGIAVKYMGVPLSDYLKEDRAVLAL